MHLMRKWQLELSNYLSLMTALLSQAWTFISDNSTTDTVYSIYSPTLTWPYVPCRGRSSQYNCKDRKGHEGISVIIQQRGKQNCYGKGAESNQAIYHATHNPWYRSWGCFPTRCHVAWWILYQKLGIYKHNITNDSCMKISDKLRSAKWDLEAEFSMFRRKHIKLFVFMIPYTSAMNIQDISKSFTFWPLTL